MAPSGGRDATHAKDGWSPKLEVGGMAKWTGRRNQIGRLLDQTIMVPGSRKQVSLAVELNGWILIVALLWKD